MRQERLGGWRDKNSLTSGSGTHCTRVISWLVRKQRTRGGNRSEHHTQSLLQQPTSAREVPCPKASTASQNSAIIWGPGVTIHNPLGVVYIQVIKVFKDLFLMCMLACLHLSLCVCAHMYTCMWRSEEGAGVGIACMQLGDAYCRY